MSSKCPRNSGCWENNTLGCGGQDWPWWPLLWVCSQKELSDKWPGIPGRTNSVDWDGWKTPRRWIQWRLFDCSFQVAPQLQNNEKREAMMGKVQRAPQMGLKPYRAVWNTVGNRKPRLWKEVCRSVFRETRTSHLADLPNSGPGTTHTFAGLLVCENKHKHGKTSNPLTPSLERTNFSLLWQYLSPIIALFSKHLHFF